MWNGIIQTVRFPLMCPACIRKDLERVDTGELVRLTCICGWSAKYELVDESVLLERRAR